MMNKSSHNNKITNKEKFLWILLGSCLDFAANVIYNSNPIDSTEFLVFWPTIINGFICLFTFENQII